MFRFRDPQPQVVKKYLYLFNFRPNIYKSGYLNIRFVLKDSDLIDNSRDQQDKG